MALFGKKNQEPKPQKSKGSPKGKKGRKGRSQEPEEEEIRGASGPSAKEQAKAAKAANRADSQRIKRIRSMKKKFDETVWSNCVDIMRRSIPSFTMTEPDPDLPGGEVVRYVLLGFETTAVDDFANKSDDDVGSILTAFKSSMDCVIEDRFFDLELILIIPTSRSLSAISEFVDTFDLKFRIVYVTEDADVLFETRYDSDQLIYVTIDQIRGMLEHGTYIGDLIDQLRRGSSGDFDEFEGGGEEQPAARSGLRRRSALDDDDDDVVPEDELPPDDDDFGDPRAAQAPPQSSPAPQTQQVRQAVQQGVDGAAQAGQQVADQRRDMPQAQAAVPVQQAPAAQPAAPAAAAQQPAAPAERPSGVQDRIRRLRGAVQQASTAAKQDPDIRDSGPAQAPARAQGQGGQQAQAQAQPPAPVQKRAPFDMTAMDQYVTRKYYSDDLNLEISSQPFDAMFLQSNPYVPFEEEPGDNWLNGYVNNLRRDCNARLSKLHYENLLLMRKRYMLIIAKHCEAITRSVSTDDPKSRFGFLRAAAETQRKDALSRIGEQAEAYKREMEENYQNRMRAEVENASNVARANFINRYQKDHERELRDVETDLRNNIEAEYVASLENINAERRVEAKRQLDAGISEALRICSDEYTKMLIQERKEYIRLQDMITSYMNENMAADEARIRVLSENLRQNNEIAKVREEYESKLSLASQDFESRMSEVRSEIDQLNLSHENEVTGVQDRYEHSMQELRSSNAEALAHKDSEIGLLSDQLARANAQIENLTRKYSSLETDTEAKYTRQIDMLKSERDAWNERADHVATLHSYTDRLKITGMIVAVVAALGIGIILGFFGMSRLTPKNSGTAGADIVIHNVDGSGSENGSENGSSSGGGSGFAQSGTDSARVQLPDGSEAELDFG